MYELVVVQAFANYKVGDRITRQEEVALVLGTNPSNVVKVPPQAQPSATQAPAA
jgi:hypothetical protein